MARLLHELVHKKGDARLGECLQWMSQVTVDVCGLGEMQEQRWRLAVSEGR